MKEHAFHLLLAIASRTSDDKAFWLPPSGLKQNSIDIGKYDSNGKIQTKLIYVSVDGAGTASALRGLENKGFIERPRTSLPDRYAYKATEKGLLFVEEYRGGK